jgi:hypothetical protein
MPRTALWLALAASALALAGCGSSGPGKSSTDGTSSTAPSPAALARAIGLRAGDLPGFKIGSAAFTDAAPLANGTCAVQTAGALAQARSPIRVNRSVPLPGAVIPEQGSRRSVRGHEGPLYTLSTLVLVDTEATEAETQLFAAIGAGARACLHNVRKAIGSEGSVTPRVTVTTLPKPVPGLPVYGVQRTECLELSKACAVASSEDRFFFAAGRVLVGVQATSTAGAFPATLAQRLLTRLYQRALAHTP